MVGKLNNIRGKKGFTLVELIVVIAIIAILTAVLVPLVGRYSAQATYASLQDTAKTISNNTGYAIADITKMGVICQSDYFKGKKENGTLTVFSSVIGEDGKNISSTGKDSIVDSDSTEELVCAQIADLLSSAVPEGCNFRIEVDHNAVISTIYSNDKNLDVTEVESSTDKIETDDEFDEGYLYDGKAVGVYGKYKK